MNKSVAGEIGQFARMIREYPPSDKCTLFNDITVPFLIKIAKEKGYSICGDAPNIGIGLLFEQNGLIFNHLATLKQFSILNEIVLNCTSEIIVLPVSILIRDKTKEGHANLLIVDKTNKTVERFEPHGAYSGELDIYESMDSHVNDELYLGSQSIGYRYIPPEEYCPRLNDVIQGPQIYEKELQYIDACKENPKGFCTVWSILYGLFRIRWPNASRKFLVNTMLVIVKDHALFIPSFITYIEEIAGDFKP